MGKLADHHLQAVEGCHHRGAQSADLAGLYITGQEVLAVIGCIVEPLGCRINKHRGQATRPEHAAYHCRANDSQHDFFCSRDCDIEHVQGVIYNRQGDHRHGVTREHEYIAVGSAQV